MIKIILDKYRQLTIGFLQVRPSKHFRDQPKSSIRKVSSLIKLETLSKKKPPNRHSPERSQTQPKYLSILSIDKYLSILSIDKYLSISSYTSWELSLISIYRTYTIIKNLTDIAKAVTTMSVFYFGFKKNIKRTNFYTSLLAYSKFRQLYKLPCQCRIFWSQDLAKELLYNFEGYI